MSPSNSKIRHPRALAIMLALTGCTLTACTFTAVDDVAQFDGPRADAAAPADYASTDLPPSDLAQEHPDLAGLNCQGNETFQAARAAMLNSCGGYPSCHMQAIFAGNLDLTDAHAYQDLVNAAASIAPAKLRVKPGDPDGSFLVQKLTNTLGNNEGGPMPRNEGIPWRAPDPAKLSVLKCWIAQGAKNN
jgi:hypothetical protein